MPSRTIETYGPQGNLLETRAIEISIQADNREAVEAKAVQGLALNATFLAIAAPTNAQVLAQTQRLTRECSALIRLLLGLLDDTAGT